MADHFVSLNRGQEGFQYNDFVTGTASSANVGIELRLGDSANYRRVDVIKALDAFKRFFDNPALWNTAGFKLSDG
jgi:hypothetical protein